MYANGTLASPTAIVAGNNIGSYAAGGFDGTNWKFGRGGLQVYGDGTWSGTSNPTMIQLTTTAANAVVQTPWETIKNNGNVGFGTEINPQIPFVISKNVATGLSFPATSYLMGLVNVDGTAAGIDVDTYGTTGAGQGSFENQRRARGTAASPSNLNTGDIIFQMQAYPYVGGFPASGPARMIMTYNDSAPNYGTFVEFDTTPAGSQTRAQAARFMAGVVIGTGATDPGVNVELLTPQAFASLTACSSALEGALAEVNNSNTATWGATIAGGGTNKVMAHCNGANWTVAGD
jgi:hypothetical protein